MNLNTTCACGAVFSINWTHLYESYGAADRHKDFISSHAKCRTASEPTAGPLAEWRVRDQSGLSGKFELLPTAHIYARHCAQLLSQDAPYAVVERTLATGVERALAVYSHEPDRMLKATRHG